ncbi:MAG: hypothetical protein ACXWWA_04125 [Chitinophagaceae bacterium]
MAIATNSIHMPHSVGMRKAGETCILKVLAYFDIFHYPLTKNEIRKFLDHPLSEINFEESLEQMLSDEVIFLHNDFYSLQNNSLLAQRRKEGNRKAGKLLPKAFKIGRFLFHFPFVRAVCISGSLSKNFADEKADIDFFVITKANRLWIARTIMHLFKKLTFLTGHQHYFCMNYYIDEEALLIEDQNIFTAMEVATLVPVCGRKTIDSFFSINEWRNQFFPFYKDDHRASDKAGNTWIKFFLEWILANNLGNYLDKWLLKITTRRWQKKSSEGMRNKNGHTMHLVTGRHFSRSNPGAFQEKVLDLYERKLNEL